MAPKHYRVYRNGKPIGMVPAHELERLVRERALRLDDLLWAPSLKNKIAVRTLTPRFRTPRRPPTPLAAPPVAGRPAESTRPHDPPQSHDPSRSEPVPPPVVAGPAPGVAAAETPANPSVVEILIATSERVGWWIVREVGTTGQALHQHIVAAMDYLVWKVRRPARRPPPLWPGVQTRFRAALGGAGIALVFALFLLAAGRQARRQPEMPEFNATPHTLTANSATEFVPGTDPSATEGAAQIADDEQSPTSALGSVAEHEPEAERLAEAEKPARAERRTVGVRIPIDSPTRDREPTRGSVARRPYGQLRPSGPRHDPMAAARAEYARQRALEEARYQAERAMRDYREQTAGNLGAMGLQWAPGGGGSGGYGSSYGPSPSAGLPPVRPYGNMPSAVPPGVSPWGP